MDFLWSPWRYRYVSSAADERCLFCRVAAETDDTKNYVLLRAERSFVMLNRYPYTSGHLMISPYAHVATLGEADPKSLEEMMLLAERMSSSLHPADNPARSNCGLTIQQ